MINPDKIEAAYDYEISDGKKLKDLTKDELAFFLSTFHRELKNVEKGAMVTVWRFGVFEQLHVLFAHIISGKDCQIIHDKLKKLNEELS